LFFDVYYLLGLKYRQMFQIPPSAEGSILGAIAAALNIPAICEFVIFEL